jgi:hypothetical protein
MDRKIDEFPPQEWRLDTSDTYRRGIKILA